MIEREPILGYRVKQEDTYIDGQILRVVDEDGATVGDQTITPIPLPYWTNIVNDLGCPHILKPGYTAYESSLHSFQNGRGLGKQLWEYAKVLFFNSRNKPYIRLIHDMSEGGWTARRVPEVLEDLDAKGIPISILYQGKFLNDRPAWILLFDRR